MAQNKVKIYILTPSITKVFLRPKMRETQLKISLMKSIQRTSKFPFPNEIEIFSVRKKILKLINAIHVNRRSFSKYFVNFSDILIDSNYSFKVAYVINIKLGLMA